MTKKIGLSLNRCLNDILRGDISIAEIKFVISATNCHTQKDWKTRLSQYREPYYPEFSIGTIENIFSKIPVVQTRLIFWTKYLLLIEKFPKIISSNQNSVRNIEKKINNQIHEND